MTYRRYYHLETYLFDEVSKKYADNGQLSVFDFFCIVIWKANRSKSKIAKRLLAQGHQDLTSAVEALRQAIANASDKKGRLRVLVTDWGFRLPMASAILTVLYQHDFTVYDVRVCNALNQFHDAQYKTNFENLWSRYDAYMECVRQAVPEHLALREKDRFLWGRSFYCQLEADIKGNFASAPADDESDD